MQPLHMLYYFCFCFSSAHFLLNFLSSILLKKEDCEFEDKPNSWLLCEMPIITVTRLCMSNQKGEQTLLIPECFSAMAFSLNSRNAECYRKLSAVFNCYQMGVLFNSKVQSMNWMKSTRRKDRMLQLYLVNSPFLLWQTKPCDQNCQCL